MIPVSLENGNRRGYCSLPPPELAFRIKRHARRLGFDHCRIVPMDVAPHADFLAGWLGLGRAGEMAYLEQHVEKRRSPALLAGTDTGEFRSLIVLAVDYHQFDLPAEYRDDPSRGVIAAYAWGEDYHELMRPLLHELDVFIRAQSGRSTPGKCLVDSGPVLERDWAHAAGIGFTGKNCCTIHPQAGSWLLLATVLVPEVLAYDSVPHAVSGPATTPEAVLHGLPANHHPGFWQIDLAPTNETGGAPEAVARRASVDASCGRCTRCLAACPTQAFVGPYHLDPQRCISYWTIESQQPIPRGLRPHFGNRIFGCDICQEVCPYNGRLVPRQPLIDGLHAQAGRVAPPLLDGFRPEHPYWLSQTAFSEHFRRSPVKRAKRHGMLRNVCVALGNWAEPAAVHALVQALDDPHPLARGAAAWALGEVQVKHGGTQIYARLEAALAGENDSHVLEEIRLAMQGNSPAN